MVFFFIYIFFIGVFFVFIYSFFFRSYLFISFYIFFKGKEKKLVEGLVFVNNFDNFFGFFGSWYVFFFCEDDVDVEVVFW